MQAPSGAPASQANGPEKTLLCNASGSGAITASHSPTASTYNSDSNRSHTGAAQSRQVPKELDRQYPDQKHHHQVRVVISDHQFHPMHLRIPPRTVVVWENRDDSQHSLNERKGAWSSPVLDPNNHFALAFEQAGSFRYYCSFFPLMEASIQVADDDNGKPGLVSTLDDLPREARFVARAQSKSLMLLAAAAAAAAAACSEGEAKQETVDNYACNNQKNNINNHNHNHRNHRNVTTPNLFVREQQCREAARTTADAARHRSAYAPGQEVASLLSLDQNNDDRDDDDDDAVEDEVGVKASSYRATSSTVVASLLERPSSTVNRGEMTQRVNIDDASDDNADADNDNDNPSLTPSAATADTVESMWTRMAQLQVNLCAEDQSLGQILDEEAEFHAQARRRLRPLLKEAVGIDQVARSFLSKQQQRNRERPAYPPLRLSTQSVTVRLLNWRFHPDRLEIPTGCTVVFVTDPNCMTHCAVMCPLAPFESGLLHSGASFAHQFLRPGVYRVFDKIYTHMPTLEITVIDIEELVPTHHSTLQAAHAEAAQTALADLPAAPPPPDAQPEYFGQPVRSDPSGQTVTENGKVCDTQLPSPAHTAVHTGHVLGTVDSPFAPTCSMSVAASQDSSFPDKHTATTSPCAHGCRRQAKMSPINERRLGLISENTAILLSSDNNDHNRHDHHTFNTQILGLARTLPGKHSRDSCSSSESALNLALGARPLKTDKVVVTTSKTTDARAYQTDHNSDTEAAATERIARKVRLRQQAQAKSVPVIPSSSQCEIDPDRGGGPFGKDGNCESYPRTLSNVAYRAAAPTVTFGSFAVRPVRQGGAQRAPDQRVQTKATNGSFRAVVRAKSLSALSRSNHDQNGEDADDETNGTSDDESYQDGQSGRFEAVTSVAQDKATDGLPPEPSYSPNCLPAHAAAKVVNDSSESTSPHRRIGPARAPMFGSTAVTVSRRAARKQRALAFQRAMAAAAAANSDETAAAAARHALCFGSDSATGTDSLVDRAVSSTSPVERMVESDADILPPFNGNSPGGALVHRQANEKAGGTTAPQGVAGAGATGVARATTSSIALVGSTLPKKRAKKRLSKKQRQRKQRQEQAHRSSQPAAGTQQGQQERAPRTKHPSQLDAIIDDTAAIVSASAALALSPRSRLRSQAAGDSALVHDNNLGNEGAENARRDKEARSGVGRNSYPVSSAVAAAVLKVAAHRRVGPARAVFVDGDDDTDDDDDGNNHSNIDGQVARAVQSTPDTVSTDTTIADLSPATLQAATTSVSLGWRHSRAQAKRYSYNMAARMIAQSRHDNGSHRTSSLTPGSRLPGPQNRIVGTHGSFSQPIRPTITTTTPTHSDTTLNDKPKSAGEDQRAVAITAAGAAATTGCSASDYKYAVDTDTPSVVDTAPLTASKRLMSPFTTCVQNSGTNAPSSRLGINDVVSHECGTVLQRSGSSAGNERHRPPGRRSRKERQKSRLQLQEELIAAQVTSTSTTAAESDLIGPIPEQTANHVHSFRVSAQVQSNSNSRSQQDGESPPLPAPSGAGTRKKKKRRRRKKPGRPPNEVRGCIETVNNTAAILTLSPPAAVSTQVATAPVVKHAPGPVGAASPRPVRPDLTTQPADVPALSPGSSSSLQAPLSVSTSVKEPSVANGASTTVKVRRSDAAAQQIASLLGLQPELTSTPPASPLKGAGHSESDDVYSVLLDQERSANSAGAGKTSHDWPSQGCAKPSMGSDGSDSNVKRELFAEETCFPTHELSNRNSREGGQIALDQSEDGQQPWARSRVQHIPFAHHPVPFPRYPGQRVFSGPASNGRRHHLPYAQHTGYHWQTISPMPMPQHPHGPAPGMGNHFTPPYAGHQGLWPNAHAPVQYLARPTNFPPEWYGSYSQNPMQHMPPTDSRVPGQYTAHVQNSHSSPMQHQFEQPAQRAQLQTFDYRGDTSQGEGSCGSEQKDQEEQVTQVEQEQAAAAAAAAAGGGGGGGLHANVGLHSGHEACPQGSKKIGDLVEFESGEMDWSDCSWNSDDDTDVPDTFQSTTNENMMFAEGSVCPKRLSPTTVAQRERDLAEERARAAASVRRFLDNRLRESKAAGSTVGSQSE